VKLYALLTISFFFSIQFVFAQPAHAELDPEKWAVELSKKDRSVYDSLPGLISKLQKIDSLQAFQFIDELAEKRR